jgi:hypothetical protein
MVEIHENEKIEIRLLTYNSLIAEIVTLRKRVEELEEELEGTERELDVCSAAASDALCYAIKELKKEK